MDSEDEEEGCTLKKGLIAGRGIICVQEGDGEATIRVKLISCRKGKYSMIGPNDFDFAKVTRKNVSVLGEGTEYDYSVVKKLAGQGLLYIRMKEMYQFILDEPKLYSDQHPASQAQATQEIQQEIPQVTELVMNQ